MPSPKPDQRISLSELALHGLSDTPSHRADTSNTPRPEDPISKLVRLLQVLSRQENSGAFGVKPLDFLPERQTAHRVEASRRFVEEENARRMNE